MLDKVLESALNFALSQGGGWVAAVVIGIISYFVIRALIAELREQNKRYLDSHEDAEKENRAQFEKRLEEARETLAALNRASLAQEELKKSVEARTVALNELTVGFAKFVSDADARSDRWMDFRRSIEQFQADTLATLRRLEAK